MGLNIEYEEGQTPLDEDEKDGLKILTIATRNELDEFEQQNIEQAIQWTLKRKIKTADILAEHFIRKIHLKMYGNVWQWAGEFRKTNKNIGVDKWQIATELKSLLEDTKYWIENNIYGADEIAIRFKHRLVSIHCFPNGNRRHSRLMADIIVEKVFGKKVFSWGASNLSKQNETRKAYLVAIRKADKGDNKLILDFARS